MNSMLLTVSRYSIFRVVCILCLYVLPLSSKAQELIPLGLTIEQVEQKLQGQYELADTIPSSSTDPEGRHWIESISYLPYNFFGYDGRLYVHFNPEGKLIGYTWSREDISLPYEMDKIKAYRASARIMALTSDGKIADFNDLVRELESKTGKKSTLNRSSTSLEQRWSNWPNKKQRTCLILEEGRLSFVCYPWEGKKLW